MGTCFKMLNQPKQKQNNDSIQLVQSDGHFLKSFLDVGWLDDGWISLSGSTYPLMFTSCTVMSISPWCKREGRHPFSWYLKNSATQLFFFLPRKMWCKRATLHLGFIVDNHRRLESHLICAPISVTWTDTCREKDQRLLILTNCHS